MLQTHGAAARLHSALIVPRRWPREARLEHVVRRQRSEARRELALRPDEHARHRRLEIVVEQPLRHAAQVRERAHMPIEEGHLVLPRVQPREVAPRVHEPQQEHPRLAPLASGVDEHLEEVHLAEIAWPVHERHEHLLRAPLALRHQLLDQRDADAHALAHQQPVQPRRRQPLLAARRSRRAREQRLEPRLHRRRPRRRPPHADRHALLQVPPHRIARQPHVLGHLPRRPPLDPNFVPDYVYLIHPQHLLPAEPPAPMADKPRRSPGWITFRAASGSLSRRRDHEVAGVCSPRATVFVFPVNTAGSTASRVDGTGDIGQRAV